MIRAFFEGPAGSGKTHQLIEEAVAASPDVLVTPDQKLLALTFMNGARQRLNLRFGEVPALRSRFVCLTFDSFAGSVTHRRRSLLPALPPELVDASVNEFDRTCIHAARLLEHPAVADWVASAYPLVVVDEAQDLDPHRFRILKAVAKTSCVVAAADEFQNLNEHLDATAVMTWLRTAKKPITLTQIRRTSRDGLLRVAAALRDGKNVCQELKPVRGLNPCLAGAGLRIIETPAKDGLLAWSIANELDNLGSRTAILTPDAKGDKVRTALSRVSTEPFSRNKKAGTVFGPFSLAWERRDDEEVAMLLSAVTGDGALPLGLVIDALSGTKHPECRHVCDRLHRARNVRGMTSVTRDQLVEIAQDVLRDAGRFRPRSTAGRAAMTIQRAKNREFRDVLVLWPHSVRGSDDHQRRLLYNALTRTQERCSIVVFGKGRLGKPPFTE